MFAPGLLPGLILGLATTTAPAETYTVAPGSPGTIQALIDLVLVDGDVIQLEAGTYLLPDTITIIDRSITIRGVSDPKTGEPLSILDGQDTHRVCLTNDGSNTFEGLVFTRGFAFSSNGGGLQGDNNILNNCVFDTNMAPSNCGGGLSGLQNQLTNCSFNLNQAECGGGVFGAFNTFDHCNFNSNQARNGGGLYSFGLCTLNHCGFDSNQAESGAGGGLYAGNLTANGCTFTVNTALAEGGGLYVFGENTLTDCLITGNTAPLGAGIFLNSNPSDSTDLTTCTISGNTAQKAGGGLWIGELTTVRISDSSICENAPEDIYDLTKNHWNNQLPQPTPFQQY